MAARRQWSAGQERKVDRAYLGVAAYTIGLAAPFQKFLPFRLEAPYWARLHLVDDDLRAWREGDGSDGGGRGGGPVGGGGS